MGAQSLTDRRRIASIDGLRALAILAVVAFHYCYRWGPPLSAQSLYPYGRGLADLAGVSYGAFGVHLFFVISGFVIAMTLERCRTPFEFAVRRYARLGPAMLLFSLITFAAMRLIPGAPFPEHLVWFTSSVTFVDPVYLNRLAPGVGFGSIAGVYWSLYVEVQFYALACVAYFLGGRWFRVTMAVLSAAASALLVVRIPFLSPVSNNLLIPLFLPWFVMGIGFHELALRAQWLAGPMLIGLGTLELVAQHAGGAPGAVPVGVVLFVPLLFAAAIWLRPLASLLSWAPVVAIGAASYGLYLVHENIGITILHSLPAPMSPAAGAFAAFAVAVGCIAVALASFRWIEQPLSRRLRTWLLAPGVRGSRATPAPDCGRAPARYAAD